MVVDEELDGARLVSAVEAIIDEPGRIDEMSDAARSIGRLDAAERVAGLMEEHAR